MPFVTIDVVPERNGARHFEVVIKRGEKVLAYWNVGDLKEGEAEVLKAIKSLNKKHNPDII